MRFDTLGSRIEAALSSWREIKLLFERAVAVSNETIHVVVGVFILLLSAALLRKPVSSWTPWLVVLGFAVVNEFVDLALEQWPQPSVQFGESINDLWVTMLLPSVLLFTARKTPGLYCPEPRPRSAGAEIEGS